MALIKCKECGTEISDKASTCPKCGAPIKKRGCGCTTVLLGFFIFFVVVGVAINSSKTSTASSNPPPTPTTPAVDQGNKVEAFTMAEEFIKKRLKAPSTADFGGIFHDYQDPNQIVVYEGGGNYKVTIWVDAQNSFGAKIRSHFILSLHDKGTGTWELLDEPVSLDQ